MEFEKLFLSRNYHGSITGSVSFKNELGEISLKVDDAFAQSLLEACGDALIGQSKRIADEMNAKVVEAVVRPAIESQPPQGGDNG